MTHTFTGFAARLKAEPMYAAFCGVTEPVFLDALLRDGFDTAILDMQHGAFAPTTAIAGIAAGALLDKPVFVRPPVGDFATAARMLDAGAIGIIAPMVNTIEDARRLAAWTKFPPLGERSWGPFRALSFTGLSMPDYLAKANGFSLTIAMVETREALNILDDILATPGIDGVFVGPSDLSIALTKGAVIDQLHPEVDAALTAVATRARAHGKIASCFSPTAERAAELVRRGFHLSSIGTDVSIVKAAVKAELATARGLAKPAGGQKGY